MSLTGAGTTTVTGTYPNFTITSADAYTGTVTSVGTGTGLTGGTITTTGTISFAVAAVGTWAATPSSANLASALTDETGSGLVVFNDAPSLSRPTIDGANPYIQFSNGAAVALAAGRMWYDGATGSLNFGMGGGNITQQVGEEIFVYGKASSNITEGQLICQTGVVGASGQITFGPTPANLTNNDGIIGVATENITSGNFGRITFFGVVRGIDTTGSSVGETWADGDTLWYNPAGAGKLTNVKPIAPSIRYSVAKVIHAGSGGSGSIQVYLEPGSTLGGTDSNVEFSTPVNTNLIQYNGTYWTNVTPASILGIGSALNLSGGSAGAVPYQSGAGATAFTAVGSTGQVLTSQGSGTPTWTTPTAYATVTDDTTTNGTRYPLFANQTTGNLTTEYTSSTKLQYNPSTGILTATGFSGSGANLTALPAGQLSGTIPSGVLGNSTLYIGTTAVVLNAASGSITSLAVNISGSAASASTATTATNATNVAVTDDTSTNAAFYPAILSNSTGNLPIKTSSTKLQFNPSTGVLTATGGMGGGAF